MNACHSVGRECIFLEFHIHFRLESEYIDIAFTEIEIIFFKFHNRLYKVIEKIREMSFGLPNMSEMLKYADNEIKEAAVERRGSSKKNESNKPTPSPSARSVYLNFLK